jgi:hypothetical protein
MKLSILLSFMVLPALSFAQNKDWAGPHMPDQNKHFIAYTGKNEMSSLSVYSTHGEQFMLVLNGIAQNNTPVTKIRVEQLPQGATDIEIVFTDGRTPALRKRVVIADPVNVKPVDMLLEVSPGGNEAYPTLRFVQCTRVVHDYQPSPDEYVMCFGKPGRNAAPSNEPPAPPQPTAMDDRTFSQVRNSIVNTSFEDTKLSTAKTILAANYVNANQVTELLCKLFSFEETKVKFAEYAYSKTVDPSNYFQVANVFSFDASKTELNNFIRSKQSH